MPSKKALLNEHLKYFKEHQKIEFEGLVESKKFLNLQEKLTQYETNILEPSLREGIDVWRKEEAIKSTLLSPQFANIFSELCNQQELIYAFSIYLSPKTFDDEYSLLLRKAPLNHILGGYSLCIKGGKTDNPYCLTEENSALFFSANEDFYLRFFKPKGAHLFTFFAKPVATFSPKAGDILSMHFRSEGYQAGDQLKPRLNPKYFFCS